MDSFAYIEKLITNTPIVDITYTFNNQTHHIYAKCEWYSLTGSIKDKPAYKIIKDAYESGKLHKGQPIVEVSSGNMGISISAIANLTGNPVTILMPRNMSEERKKLIKLYGATLVETDNFLHAFNLAKVYEKNGFFYPKQFENESNSLAHRDFTATEILKQLDDKNIEVFVSGLGTSGTLSGIGKELKSQRNIEVIAIEPENSRIITGSAPFGKHKLQGLSDEILPKLYNQNLCDDVFQISDNDAISMAKKLCRELSLGVGISSGANIVGAILTGKECITTLPDDNKKYLSTDLSKEISTPFVDSIKFLNIEVIK